MSSKNATKLETLADAMDASLFDMAHTAYANGWHDVAAALDRARNALLPRMHPADRKIAANS